MSLWSKSRDRDFLTNQLSNFRTFSGIFESSNFHSSGIFAGFLSHPTFTVSGFLRDFWAIQLLWKSGDRDFWVTQKSRSRDFCGIFAGFLERDFWAGFLEFEEIFSLRQRKCTTKTLKYLSATAIELCETKHRLEPSVQHLVPVVLMSGSKVTK